jgi:uncharacterized protein
MEVVAVLGASNDPSRYSYKAIDMLKEYGHKAIPINPREEKVQGIETFKSLADLVAQKIKVDTLTMYVNSAISEKYEKDIISLAPRRVIFNPGSESAMLEKSLKQNGVEVENACTLVMLRTNQF